MRDFAITVSHKPGELARVTNVLSLAGVNLKSVAAMTVGHQALVRMIPDDPQAARTALNENDIRFEEHEVLTLLLENRAGELTGVVGPLGDAGVNLLATYVVGVADDLLELAIITDDPKKARKVLDTLM